MKTFLNLWFHLFEQVHVQPQVVISIHITEPLTVVITVTTMVTLTVRRKYIVYFCYHLTLRNSEQNYEYV